MIVDETETGAFMEALERGIALFNEQKFFEAYEVWEERWNEEVTEGADLLQGLLQIAVGFAKLSGGSPKGAAKLLESAQPKLQMYAPRSYGLDVAAILKSAQDWGLAIERMLAQGGSAGIEFPTLEVS